MITAIVHVDREWGIGKGNDMMFSLPKDMKFFRETTMGNTVVMGGNTLRSFPNQKPLKNRVNIVLSRGQVRDDCIIVRSYEELKNQLKNRQNEEIFIGGKTNSIAVVVNRLALVNTHKIVKLIQVWEEHLRTANRIYLGYKRAMAIG